MKRTINTGILRHYGTISIETEREIKVEVFWVVASCSVAVGYHRFGEPYCLHIQGETLVFCRNIKLHHYPEDLDLYLHRR
jgi:hypothetical protein